MKAITLKLIQEIDIYEGFGLSFLTELKYGKNIIFKENYPLDKNMNIDKQIMEARRKTLHYVIESLLDDGYESEAEKTLIDANRKILGLRSRKPILPIPFIKLCQR